MLLVMSTEHVILVGIGPGVLQSVSKVTTYLIEYSSMTVMCMLFKILW